MRIHELLAEPTSFCVGALAQTANGEPTAPHDPGAASWCLVGAMIKCYPDSEGFVNVYSTVERQIIDMKLDFPHDRTCRVVSFSDMYGHATVLALVKKLDV